jgi:hypothetical protein
LLLQPLKETLHLQIFHLNGSGSHLLRRLMHLLQLLRDANAPAHGQAMHHSDGCRTSLRPILMRRLLTRCQQACSLNFNHTFAHL